MKCYNQYFLSEEEIEEGNQIQTEASDSLADQLFAQAVNHIKIQGELI